MKIIPVAVTGSLKRIEPSPERVLQTGIGTTILLLYLMTDENARSFQVKKIRALKSALEILAEKRYIFLFSYQFFT